MPPRLVRFIKTVLATLGLSLMVSLGASYLWDWLILQAYGSGMGPKEALGFILPWPQMLETSITWAPIIFGGLLVYVLFIQLIFPKFTRGLSGLMVLFTVLSILGYGALELWLGVQTGLLQKAHYDVPAILARLPLFGGSFVLSGIVTGFVFWLLRRPDLDKLGT